MWDTQPQQQFPYSSKYIIIHTLPHLNTLLFLSYHIWSSICLDIKKWLQTAITIIVYTILIISIAQINLHFFWLIFQIHCKNAGKGFFHYSGINWSVSLFLTQSLTSLKNWYLSNVWKFYYGKPVIFNLYFFLTCFSIFINPWKIEFKRESLSYFVRYSEITFFLYSASMFRHLILLSLPLISDIGFS